IASLRSRPKALTFSPDGRWLAAAESGAIRIWDLATPAPLPRFQIPGARNPESLAFSVDSQWVAETEATPHSAIQAWKINPDQGLGSSVSYSNCAWSSPLSPSAQDPLLTSRIPSLADCFSLARIDNNNSWSAAAVDPVGQVFAAG